MASVRGLRDLVKNGVSTTVGGGVLRNENNSCYFLLTDGRSCGAEFAWMPESEKWVWYDKDGLVSGCDDCLMFVFSMEDGDESGLNRTRGLITAELDDNLCLWVFAGDDAAFGLPDDALVFTLRNPREGLVEVPLVNGTILVEYSLDSLGDITPAAFEAKATEFATALGYAVEFSVGLNNRETLDGEPVDMIVEKAFRECCAAT